MLRYKKFISFFNSFSSSNFYQLNNKNNFATFKMSGKNSNNEDFLPDFPPGPLDIYRQKASFDWRSIATTMVEEYILRYKHKVWKELEDDPIFAHSTSSKASLEDDRHRTTMQMLRTLKFLPKEDPDSFDPFLSSALTNSLGAYNWSVSIKRMLLFGFVHAAIRGIGTKRHNILMEKIENHEIFGCFSLTEMSHGTNTKQLRTRASFDVAKKRFIIHTPDFEAAKCWVGNLGKTATHTIVFAQLYTPDGQCHGLHAFIVQIRSSSTLLPLPGVNIGDMGGKVGLNGLDNGWIMFDNFEIPYESLLNKTGDVTLEGLYETPIKDPRKRFGASLGNLSSGRVGIIQICTVNLIKAITTGIRYSAARRQFGNENGKELPVIEYQMQQWRLFPYLAASYVLIQFGDSFFKDFIEFNLMMLGGDDKDTVAIFGQEIHAVSSAGKPLAGWLARDCIQECREGCGGHGYLACTGFAELRNDNDANCTYEGDNNVLLQQTSNWLIGIWENPKIHNIKTPLNTLSFLKDINGVLSSKFKGKTEDDLRNPQLLLDIFKWLLIFQLKSSSEKLKSEKAIHKNDSFAAKNDSQVYQARTLSLIFIQHFLINRFNNFVNSSVQCEANANVLRKLLLLFGYFTLEKHTSILYSGGYIEGPLPLKLIQQFILTLCKELKNDAVSLVDSIAFPDFIQNSVLGKSDGEIYKNLQQAFNQTEKGYERASFWKEIVEKIKSKI